MKDPETKRSEISMFNADWSLKNETIRFIFPLLSFHHSLKHDRTIALKRKIRQRAKILSYPSDKYNILK